MARPPHLNHNPNTLPNLPTKKRRPLLQTPLLRARQALPPGPPTHQPLGPHRPIIPKLPLPRHPPRTLPPRRRRQHHPLRPRETRRLRPLRRRLARPARDRRASTRVEQRHRDRVGGLHRQRLTRAERNVGRLGTVVPARRQRRPTRTAIFLQQRVRVADRAGGCAGRGGPGDAGRGVFADVHRADRERARRLFEGSDEAEEGVVGVWG